MKRKQNIGQKKGSGSTASMGKSTYQKKWHASMGSGSGGANAGMKKSAYQQKWRKPRAARAAVRMFSNFS